jgi:hypothetical protein
VTHRLQWAWELEERMSLQQWLKRHYELLNRKEGETKSTEVKAQCFERRKIVVPLMQYANTSAIVRREQQGMIGMDIERIAYMKDATQREIWRDSMILLGVINNLTG